MRYLSILAVKLQFHRWLRSLAECLIAAGGAKTAFEGKGEHARTGEAIRNAQNIHIARGGVGAHTLEDGWDSPMTTCTQRCESAAADNALSLTLLI